jgi:hypothetical protein
VPLTGAETARVRGDEMIAVGGAFFEALDIVPLSGRLPTAEELRAGAPVTVVSQRLARALWPDGRAVGQLLATRGRSVHVIGVVGDARFAGLDRVRGQMYVPVSPDITSGIMVVAPQPGAQNLLRDMLHELDAMGSAVDVTRASTIEDAFADLLRPRSFEAWLLGGFAGAALIILTVGVIGLVAMLTAGRTREIGIRCALGARRDAITRLLVVEQFAAVAAGLAAGALLTWWAVGLLRLSLYQFSAYDVRLWAIGIIAVIAAATAGALIPALRASRIDPVSALRAE